MKKIFASLAIAVSFVSFVFAPAVLAESTPLEIKKEGKAPGSFVINIQDCISTGNCSLCDVLKFFGTIAQWILATVGGLALLFFVLGGFDLITSRGNQEAVEKGKKKITGALIGLLIVLASYTLINAILGFFIVTPTEKGPKRVFMWKNISCE